MYVALYSKVMEISYFLCHASVNLMRSGYWTIIQCILNMVSSYEAVHTEIRRACFALLLSDTPQRRQQIKYCHESKRGLCISLKGLNT